MTGLLDLVPPADKVQVNGSQIPVYGVSAAGIAHLLGRFPELREMMAGREVEASRLMAMGGECVAAIIAAGCGHPGDAEAERIAGLLPAHTQAELIGPIVKLTFPRGVGPFVERLIAASDALGLGALSVTAPDMTSPSPSSGSSAVDTASQT